MPVVIFGHGLVTERRFVLAIGDALAAKGFAAISIDFPYHGDAHVLREGRPDLGRRSDRPAASRRSSRARAGTTCNDVGKCVDAHGQRQPPRDVRPVLDMPVASGAMFLEIEHIANTQGSLPAGARRPRRARSLAAQRQLARRCSAAPSTPTQHLLRGPVARRDHGRDVPRHRSPDIQRAVLNVPGADLDPDVRRLDVLQRAARRVLHARAASTARRFEGQRLLTVATLVHGRGRSAAPRRRAPATRALLLQMATLDFIIPNDSRRCSRQVTGAPRRDYVAEHGFITIPIEPEYLRGVRDLAKFLNGEALVRHDEDRSLAALARGARPPPRMPAASRVGEQTAVVRRHRRRRRRARRRSGRGVARPGGARRRRRPARRPLARSSRGRRSRRARSTARGPHRQRRRVVDAAAPRRRATRAAGGPPGSRSACRSAAASRGPPTGRAQHEVVSTELLRCSAPRRSSRGSFGALRVSAGVHVDAGRLQIAAQPRLHRRRRRRRDRPRRHRRRRRRVGVLAAAARRSRSALAYRSRTRLAARPATRTSRRPTRSARRRPTSTRRPR